jgi:hypothetical protein
MTKHRPPSVPDAERDYPVGYRKPDKRHAFTKGNRANPKGRTRKHKTNSEIVLELLSESFELRVDGKVKKITGREAIFRVQLAKAMKGDTKAAEFLFRHLDDHGTGLDVQDLEAGDLDIVVQHLRQLGADPKAIQNLIGPTFGDQARG